MNSISQPVSTYRGPTLSPLTVGALRSILKNIPADFDGLIVRDSNGSAINILSDSDWLNFTVSTNPPGVVLKIN